ncbi:MAG: DUF6491 family protein [Gammaproteobacteria bacterium]|jgi:hypothetical protein|nr:DUF6491 family protein [Gammaproteobacteria bacterium]MDH3749195.1 DUF6491 family protein [Gammaproteobacteria bacterium]MDH3805361.1 DUF6491 family protein [Gammaproteobacteria bacterium]
MKFAPLMIAATLLAACAAQDEKDQSTQDAVQAVRDFIEVRDLEELDKMPSASSDGWEAIDNQFLIYRGRRDAYLVEFTRRCFELDDNTRIVADRRWDANVIRARFDTIRGCRIHKIYALTEAETVELENIGEAPGSRN